MSSHHPPPIPQPRQGGWVRQVRSAWSPGHSPQAKSWALTSELKQGRWGRAHPGWTEGQGQHVRSGGKHAGLLWGWTGAASPPMSFMLCSAQGSLSMGWGSPAAHAPRAAQLHGVTAVWCRGDVVGHPLNPHPGGPSPSEACCSAQQGPRAPPEWGRPCSQIPSSLGCGAGTEHPMQHRGPRDPLVTATPGSFCRGCTAWEQAEVGPCTKASSLFPPPVQPGEAASVWERLVSPASRRRRATTGLRALRPVGVDTPPPRLTAQGRLTAASWVTAQPSCGQWAAGRRERRGAQRSWFGLGSDDPGKVGAGLSSTRRKCGCLGEDCAWQGVWWWAAPQEAQSLQVLELRKGSSTPFTEKLRAEVAAGGGIWAPQSPGRVGESEASGPRAPHAAPGQ